MEYAMAKKQVASTSDEFALEFKPLESTGKLFVLTDSRTGAKFCECHIKASTMVARTTTDVPLDPEEQSEYRANREIVTDAYAFEKMKDDAINGRTFSNIVAEYTKEFDPELPLKIIGGQHRFQAIKQALEQGVDEWHGVKVYFDLTKDQRLDVQLISNTAIAISSDLFDRMQETVSGPHLRNWCQNVGLLGPKEDFADKRARGGRISVQIARTFISNYYAGHQVDPKKFDATDTSPLICPSGQHDQDWDALVKNNKKLFQDAELQKAAKEFVRLVMAQRKAFENRNQRTPPDFPEKAMNLAVLSAWAYIAGMLRQNEARLKRHFALADTGGRDPLNASALAKGRHKTDPENYRGLGYRTDAKERGRLAELFFYQAEESGGITGAAIDIAIKKYHAKQAQIEVLKAKAKGK
jgi:hypothetical protein